ncbi:MAG: 2-hydroxyacid dehydrogenase [Dehalococcoidia bacterium]
MPRSRVFLATTLIPSARAIVESACEVVAYEGGGRISREELEEALQDVDGVLTSNQVRFDNDLLDACSRLRVISNNGVGYDNVDIPYATSRQVLVCNTPGVLTDAVADLTYGFIIDLTRGITRSDRYVRERRWGKEPAMPLGMDLRGKTLGVLGLGRIGTAVAQRAPAFGLNVVYYDPIRNHSAEDRGLAQYRERDAVLRESDVVSVHVFLDPTTHRHISEREFSLMKPNAFLVNTSRGLVINQPDLVAALQSGQLAGAALDVFELEPPDPSDALLDQPNVILAPHIGSATTETRQAMAELAARNVVAAVTGGEPECMVNPEVRRMRASP